MRCLFLVLLTISLYTPSLADEHSSLEEADVLGVVAGVGTCACGGRRDSALGTFGEGTMERTFRDETSALSDKKEIGDTDKNIRNDSPKKNIPKTDAADTTYSSAEPIKDEQHRTSPTQQMANSTGTDPIPTKDDLQKQKNIIQEQENLLQMAFIEGGTFFMGSANPLIPGDGEGPMRLVTVSDFLIDRYEVSNEDYLKFIDSTGYRTDSEIYGWSFVFESAVPKRLKARITQAVLGAEWWLPVNGSYWREPEGPGTDVFSSRTYRGTLPAVHISWTDAVAYCGWRGARLPTEAEWEYAAQGKGKSKSRKDPKNRLATTYPWGNKLTPKGGFRANIFQGDFPSHNTGEDGFEYLAPVDSFPHNDYGLHNMIGNAWEWVGDWFTANHNTVPSTDPKGPSTGRDKVKKGGSFLCHRSFCYRYRHVSRYASTPESATQNSGFRCAGSAPEDPRKGGERGEEDDDDEL